MNNSITIQPNIKYTNPLNMREEAPQAKPVKQVKTESEPQKAHSEAANEDAKVSKTKAALLTLAGAILPLVALNLHRGAGKAAAEKLKSNAGFLEKLESVAGIFKTEGFADIAASSAGAVLAGTASGVSDCKNEKQKIPKYKTAIFEYMNVMIPTIFLVGFEKLAEKTGKLQSSAAKAGIIVASVAGGMFIANKGSNKVNEAVFKEKTEHKFKISDCFVHADDILALLVLAKNPWAAKLHVDKFLPLLYAHSGYEVATAGEEEHKH